MNETRSKTEATKQEATEVLQQDLALQRVIQKKDRFIFRTTAAFLVVYLFLPLSVVLLPDLVKRYWLHPVLSFAWFYAIVLFSGTWLLGWWYWRRVRIFDRQIAALTKKIDDQG